LSRVSSNRNSRRGTEPRDQTTGQRGGESYGFDPPTQIWLHGVKFARGNPESKKVAHNARKELEASTTFEKDKPKKKPQGDKKSKRVVKILLARGDKSPICY